MKLKEILKVEKKHCPVKCADTREFRNGLNHGFDQAIDEIGNMKILLDEEKVARHIWENTNFKTKVILDTNNVYRAVTFRECRIIARSLNIILPQILTLSTDKRE